MKAGIIWMDGKLVDRDEVSDTRLHAHPSLRPRRL